jgi:hypothetical protein
MNTVTVQYRYIYNLYKTVFEMVSKVKLMKKDFTKFVFGISYF